MTDANPPENEKPINEIVTELQELGRNLRDMLQTVWESEERKKVQTEIETGLKDLGASLNQAAQDFNTSPAGQTIKSDVEDLKERLRTGEVQSKVRSDVLTALKSVNNELKKVVSKKE